jgi:hypothetical protein
VSGRDDTMQAEIKHVLVRQFDVAWKLASFHLDGLTTEECLWRPAATGPHVRAVGTSGWQRTGHSARTTRSDRRASHGSRGTSASGGRWCWITHLERSRFRATTSAGPGSGDEVRVRIVALHDEWRTVLHAVTDQELRSTSRTRWPFADRPFADVVSWVNVELSKNAAEIGYARFLYAAR